MAQLVVPPPIVPWTSTSPAGLVDARPAVPVVGAGQRSPRRAQCECGSGQEVMGDGSFHSDVVGGAGVGRGDQRERDCGERRP